MDLPYYLDKFQKSVDLLDKERFSQKQLDLKVGVWMDSVCLKIQKKSWLNNSPNAKPFSESFFFSIWINDDTLKKGKVYYNIHAIKTRELTDYKIKSRDFADAFDNRFEPYKKDWSNVYNPLAPHTLMEGWVKLDLNTLEGDLIELASKFPNISFIIDELLAERKK
jgi:hypothetical protein